MKKRIPTGVVNYNELQTENYYVVDKSSIIQDVLERGSKVTLITRPRRFGKTSNMSMMSEFFDITKHSENIFKNTAIENSEYITAMNTYPVIFLSFASAKGGMKNSTKVIKQQIAEVYQKYGFVLEQMDDFEKPFYESIKDSLSKPESGDLQGVESALLFLMKKIEEYYNKKTILFIDEYDTPFIEAHVQGFYNIIRGSLSTLLHSALKDNDHLQYAMLTGIQRVAKENIFSDLNNLEVFTVKDKEYAQYFGFTEQETKEFLAYYELELNEDVKNMYDGYNIGGIEIYNPWSIINYAKRQELVPYWVNTSSNTMIKQAMISSSQSFKDSYEALIMNGFLDTQVTMDTSFYEDDSTNTLWGLFVNAGYLTIDKINNSEEDEYRLRIPNREVLKEFKSLTAEYLHVQTKELSDLYKSIKTQDQHKFLKAYQQLIMMNPSYYDLKDENSYHMFMLGICLYISNDYKIISNREVGSGRCDIILHAKRKDVCSYIIEFKYTKEKDCIDNLALQGMKQIKQKNYNTEIQHPTIYISLAHCGKLVTMLWETSDMLEK